MSEIDPKLELPLVEPPSSKNTAAFLNSKFKEGVRADEVLEQLRSIQKPILIDLNGTICSRSRVGDYLAPAPEGVEFIKRVSQVGTPIVVTDANSWEVVQNTLDHNSLWTEEMILLVRGNWEFTGRHDGYHDVDGGDLPIASQLIDEYVSNMAAQDKKIDRELFNWYGSGKRLAPLFMKSFDIPLVDDDDGNTEHNPGVLGITVEQFDPQELEKLQEIPAEQREKFIKFINKDKVTLLEAAKIIEAHYE